MGSAEPTLNSTCAARAGRRASAPVPSTDATPKRKRPRIVAEAYFMGVRFSGRVIDPSTGGGEHGRSRKGPAMELTEIRAREISPIAGAEVLDVDLRSP